MTRRFAEHGSDAFNDSLESAVADLAADVRAALGNRLVALVLGGGYARAEGGVANVNGREQAYNDLDFTLIVDRKPFDSEKFLAPISAKYGQRLGIDVDFSRPLTLDDIRRWPHWLMWTDLLCGHRVIAGDEGVLTDNAPAVLRESPPLIEATRLLLNRGAGLLWSLRIRRGLDKPHDADFVRRNLHKCVLAMGDAAIIVHKRHQTPYRGRDILLAILETQDPAVAKFALLEPYREALAFRLRPGIAEPDTYPEAALLKLAEDWAAVWLFTESARAHRPFADVKQYCAWSAIREPEQHGPARWPRNLVRNAQAGRLSLRYPREKLFRELPKLLTTDVAAPDWAARSAEFLTLWRRFN